MPFGVRKSRNSWKAVNTDTGRVFGTHPTKEKAAAQVRALYANVPDAKTENIESEESSKLKEIVRQILQKE